MKKYCVPKHICSLLLLIFINPCYGQIDGHTMFSDAIQDKAGNLWFATIGKGVYRYDAATGVRTNLSDRDGLCNNNVSSILEDKAGNLWFATAEGVCIYDGKSFTDITTKIGLCNIYVSCILEDRNGNFWFGNLAYGVCRYNPVTGVVTSFTKEHGLSSNTVYCILEDKAGNLWFGERAGGVCRYDSASGRFTKVYGEGCLGTEIMGIIEDKTGNIWFAHLYRGVCRYESASGVFTHITEEIGLCKDIVTCIYEDRKGNIWFGSDASASRGRGGVCRYDGKSFAHFSTIEGQEDIGVWTILEDDDGNIWVGARTGLFRFHSPSGMLINYTHKSNISN